MIGKISLERLYSIGQFNNLKVIEEVTEVPEQLTGNLQAHGLLEYLMLLSIEKTYRKYLKLQTELSDSAKGITENDEKLQASINYIEEAQSKTFKELFDLISDTKQEN